VDNLVSHTLWLGTKHFLQQMEGIVYMLDTRKPSMKNMDLILTVCILTIFYYARTAAEGLSL